jgi:anti-anti-sigma factor
MTADRAPEILKQDGVTIIALGPEFEQLDELHLDDLTQVVLDAANAADPPLVVVDLSHTRFFGSGFIEVLFRAWHRLHGREGGRLGLCGLTPYCREVIDVTHLDRLWSIYATREEAVGGLSSSS